MLKTQTGSSSEHRRPPWHISIAPMVNRSTRQMRYLWRQLCSNCLLYTEMLPVPSLLNGKTHKMLEYDPIEKPLALQLADNSPARLAKASALAREWNYDEINLNLGCPSCKLSQANFGACMIKEPRLSAECVAAMRENAGPKMTVTVKTRLGVDDWDDDDKLQSFVEKLSQAGAQRIIIHARKAWLKGLSPQQNRNTPPLQYERVAKLQKSFPNLPITLNGGINDMEQLDKLVHEFGSIMIGRLAYNKPLSLLQIGRRYWQEESRDIAIHELVKKIIEYAQQRYRQGEAFRHSGIHMLNLYNGTAGARQYRQKLSSILSSKQIPSFRQIATFLPDYPN